MPAPTTAPSTVKLAQEGVYLPSVTTSPSAVHGVGTGHRARRHASDTDDGAILWDQDMVVDRVTVAWSYLVPPITAGRT